MPQYIHTHTHTRTYTRPHTLCAGSESEGTGSSSAMETDSEDGESADSGNEEGEGETKSSAQLAEEIVTLSSMPQSFWQNLLNLELIKERNKPTEAPAAPEQAPFFLPTVPGLVPKVWFWRVLPPWCGR